MADYTVYITTFLPLVIALVGAFLGYKLIQNWTTASMRAFIRARKLGRRMKSAVRIIYEGSYFRAEVLMDSNPENTKPLLGSGTAVQTDYVEGFDANAAFIEFAKECADKKLQEAIRATPKPRGLAKIKKALFSKKRKAPIQVPPPTLKEVIDFIKEKQKAIGMPDGAEVENIKTRLAALAVSDSPNPAEVAELASKVDAMMNPETEKVVSALKISDAVTVTDVEGEHPYISDVLHLDEFKAGIPRGSEIAAIWSYVKNSENAALKDEQFSPAQGMKYLVIGVIIFICLAALAKWGGL